MKNWKHAIKVAHHLMDYPFNMNNRHLPYGFSYRLHMRVIRKSVEAEENRMRRGYPVIDYTLRDFPPMNPNVFESTETV